MTASFRSRLSGPSNQRGRRANDPEERFTQWVTIGFIALIAAVVAIVLIAFGVSYWNDHIKAVATVGDVSINRDQWAARLKVEFARLDHEEKKVREALSAEEIDADTANARLQQILNEKSSVATSSIENLIDLELKGRLAREAGLSVSDADVDAAIAAEELSPEARKVTAVIVSPEQNGDVRPSVAAQLAYTSASQAYDAVVAGADLADTAKQTSTDDSAANGGDLGFVSEISGLDDTFMRAIEATEPGQLTPLVQGADGAWRFGRVEEVRPGTLDASFEQAMRDGAGWDAYRDQVRKEALAAALQDKIVADAVEGDAEQARVQEIVLKGDTVAAPQEDEGSISAAHILVSPDDDPQGAASLPESDLAWAAAQQEANKIAGELRSITDPAARATRFAELAAEKSDDTGSGARGGDLGYFVRDQMVPEFADPLFTDPDLVKGDIVGPVKSAYGWHIIEYLDRIPGMGERLATLGEQLDAPGADFGAVARALSDGAQASDGGEIGWVTKDQLEQAAADAVFALEPDARTEPLPLSDGYHVYKLLEKATRPLDLLQRIEVEGSVFDTWYAEQKTAAEGDKTITRDPQIYANTPTGAG